MRGEGREGEGLTGGKERGLGKGGGGGYEEAEHHGRNGYGPTTVEEAHIPRPTARE